MGNAMHPVSVYVAYYVAYRVNRGDWLQDILKRSHMTREKFALVNPGRKPKAKLQWGESIVIQDPIATCEYHRAILMGRVEGVPQKFLNINCEVGNSGFKPLRAFTEKLNK